jgi:hypothetical protein
MKTETLELAIINPSDYGLEEAKGKELTKGLDTILKEREVLKNSYIDVIDLEITEENLATFKELRLMIVKNRTQGLDKWKKVNKAYFLAAGNFIQATYNKEVEENERMEEKLKEAENHFENLEKERIEKLQTSRALDLEPFEVENTDHLNLGIMSDEVWNNFYAGTKLGFENKKKEAEAAAKAEKEAEKIESLYNERIEKVLPLSEYKDELNHKIDFRTVDEIEFNSYVDSLRDIRNKKEKQAAEDKAERERLEKESKLVAEKSEKERLEREKKEEKRLAIEAEEKEKQKAAEEKQKAEKKALEKELAEKKAAEEKQKAEAAARIEAELAKGDEAKMQDLLKEIDWLKSKYEFKSKNNQETYRKVGLLMDKVTNFVKESL